MKKRLIIIIVLILAVLAGIYFLVFRSYCETVGPISSGTKSPQEVFPGADNVNCKNYFKAFLMLFNAGPNNAERTTPSTSFGTKADVSDWKTYRNEEYGFEVQYQPNWYELTSRGEGVILLLADQTIRTADPSSSPQNIFLITYKTNCMESDWGKVNSSELDFKRVCKQGTNLTITMQANSQENQKLEEEILSTFKFIETMKFSVVNTSTWLEYKNDQYGFKIKYPPDWSWKDLLASNPQDGNDALIGLAPKSFGGVDFEVLIQVNKRGLDANVDAISNQLNENRVLVSVSDILFKGKSGKKIILQNKTTKSYGTMIVLSGQNNLSYIISLPTEDDFRLFSTLELY